MRFFCFACASLFASTAYADEIVVTAERRGQDLFALPTNAALLTESELDFIGPQAPSEALNRLPGVAIHRGSGVESLPAFRSPVLNGGQGAGSFLILEDGVPIRAPGFANINQLYETSLDLAAGVEVTRGPGSALYGSNAVHGLVNVVTGGGRPGVRAAASLGSFGRAELDALWRGDGALIGVAFAHEDGWREDARLDEGHGLLGGNYAFGLWTAEARLALVTLEQETAGFVEGEDAYKSKALAKANANPEAFRDSKALRAHMRLERPLGDAWRVQLTPFARTVDTDLLLHFFPSKALEETSQLGAGVQTALYWDPAPHLSLILGGDLDHTRGSLREVQSLPTVGSFVQGLHYDFEVDATVVALYAQSSWAFAPNWRLIAGARAERSIYDYDNRAPDGDVGRFRRPADRRDTFDTVTPKLGLVRRFDESSAAWLNLSRGARAPQVSDLYALQTTQSPGDQDAETIDSIELGYRRAFDSGGRVELALFHMDKENGSFRNAEGRTVGDAATRHVGAELSGLVPLGAAFELSGAVSYAEHSYRFSDPVARAGESVRAGDEVDSAPNWVGALSLAWRPSDTIEAELAWTHMGAYFTNADNSRVYPGHDIVDLRVAFDVGEARLFGAIRNLFDARYAERADFAFGQDRYFPGEPRAFTLGVSLRGNPRRS